MPPPKPETIDRLSFYGVDADLVEKFRDLCAARKVRINEELERAIRAWLLGASIGDMLMQPPYDRINPAVVKEFRSRCEKNKLDVIHGIAHAMVVWIHNFLYTEKYSSKDVKGKPGRPRKKAVRKE